MTDIPWIEKYKPKSLDEIILNEYLHNKIKNIMQHKIITNIIFVGPPGTGKTLTIMCILKHLFGKYIDQGVLEIKIADDRNTKIIHESIKDFCKTTVNFGKEESDNALHLSMAGVTQPKVVLQKILLLDEADNITSKSQNLINILMDQHYNNAKFALTCNKISDIIESIQSRCDIIKFTKCTIENITQKLQFICDNEKINYNINALNIIAKDANGDMRIAINNLQLLAINKHNINLEYINTYFDKNIINIINDLLLASSKYDFKTAINKVYLIKDKGYSISDIMQTMFHHIQDSSYIDIDIAMKIKFLDIIGTSMHIISKGNDNNIQLTACIAEMCKV